MTYRIEVTNDARNDLRQIREYISVELGNENSASRTVGSIVKSIGSLRAMPEIGAPLSARVRNGERRCLPILRTISDS